MSDIASLADVVRRSGLVSMESVLEAIRNGSFEGSKERQELETATDAAVRRGAPGVPSFWIPDEMWTDRNGESKLGRLYWGQDRMQFVEGVLLAMNEGRRLSEISMPLQNLIPRSRNAKLIPSEEEVKLEFWYDFSSPWAFLGWTQLGRLQRQFGKRLQIVMKPFLLGILFRE